MRCNPLVKLPPKRQSQHKSEPADKVKPAIKLAKDINSFFLFVEPLSVSSTPPPPDENNGNGASGAEEMRKPIRQREIFGLFYLSIYLAVCLSVCR